MSAPAEVYDAVELRRRIVVCFTPGELRELADQLGVGGSIAWDRGIQEAARELVRQCDRYAGLGALVAKLREAKPLMEWPEPAATSPAPADEPAVAAPPSAPIAAPPSAPIAAPAAAPPVAAPPPVASPVWPGFAAPPPPPSRGVDPRLLVVVAALMLAAAVIAYLAGRAATAPAASEASAEAPPRPVGPAALAAGAVARHLAALIRVCELPPSPLDGEIIFRRAFDRCGPPPPPPERPLPSRSPAPLASGAPSAPADEAPDRGAPRAKHPRGDAPPGEAAPKPAKGCTGTCDAEHRACKQRCGPEPMESSGYDTYQRCLGRCLTEASHCRLACH